MVGGFLGAGKTTALLRLAEHLTAQRPPRRADHQRSEPGPRRHVHRRRAKGYPVEEITGGCFCCRFNSLTDAADRLTRDARPDVFLAEPVGSCTDLRATVQYPLRRLYGDDYRVAPLSVLVDPMRAARVLGLEPGRTLLAEGPLRLREAARRGRHHRHQQERPAERRAARRRSKRALERALSAGRRRDRQRADGREPRRLVRPPVGPARRRGRRWTSTTTSTPKARRCSAG